MKRSFEHKRSELKRSEPDRSQGSQRSMLLALGVLGASAWVVATCGKKDPPLPPPQPSVIASPPPAPSASESAPVASASAVEAPPEPEPTGPLAHLAKGLAGLEKKTRTEPVRIAWLGDSHGQADFWPGTLRSVLGKRFGYAGPGLVHLGYKKYRHDGVKLKTDGTWGLRPKGPSTSVPTDDGIFGLGGMLLRGTPSNTVALEITDDSVKGPVSYDLCWKAKAKGDGLEVRLGTEVKTLSASALGIQHEVLSTADPKAKLKLAITRGAPELCGVIVESKTPGIVVDNLGINGARVTTALAWDGPAWQKELARREPTLVILEYGTNEASDPGPKPERYAKTVVKLMARVRDAVPKASCVVLAPTERKDVPERSPVVRDGMKQGAEQAGCFFWDTYEKMGGKGGILKWMNEADPRAAPDGVHLTQKGYRVLGEALAADLLREMKL